MRLSGMHPRSMRILSTAALWAVFAAGCPCFADTAPEPAAAAAPAPTSHDVHASVDEALEHQRTRRGLGIGGMILGGSVILGASIYAATDNKEYFCLNNSGCGHRHNNAGYYIAAGVGLPLLGYSIYLFTDAQHNINQLNTSRVGFGLSPGSRTPMLQASLGF